ncbi:putative metal-binding motif-containing protein [Sandaracinus amylolyticus]|uniref:PE-PGRS family protein n=1 Tax=Sandaracinus amylolyticus TaxID=927083 RepID=A0A0F6W1D1_9BACT|nr:putative metal-binding motif-containing protein [Sandaracinus amylolyticus]AKF04783.1 PE-PGRS family protein [Sandaracinus amylolyticus]
MGKDHHGTRGGAWRMMCAVLALACSEPAPDDALDATTDDGDASVLCASDADCSDQLYCNGAERCAPTSADADARGCVLAEPACVTGQSCDEAADRCATVCAVTEDADGDGAIAIDCGGDDCDDSERRVFPGAIEICDPEHVDEDCDPTTLGALDRDADGYADEACCNDRGDGVLACGDDCNDLERTATPTSSEVCDGFDNDCDGTIDERVLASGFLDADGDLHGDPASPRMACPGETRFSAVDDDCDDADAQRHGSQSEACNARDDDCDGTIDEATSTLTWYRDADGDGFGDPNATSRACAPPAGHVLIALDCDDGDPDVHPAAAERCNGEDDDCNGRADFRVARGDYEDDDHDLRPDASCSEDEGVADCDDRNPDVRPGAPELLDGVDNDCDEAADDVCRATSWYVDGDGDGFGDGASEPMRGCEPIAGHAPRDGDCDEAAPERNPAQREVCDGEDDDCDGETDESAGSLCFLAHALGACDAGACTIDRCGRGWRDCDGETDDGCEISIATDAANCGACGTECAGGDHAMAACTMGRCGFDCDDGYGDCDGDPRNGCEADVYSDVLNCGVCGRVCSNRPNATRDCRLGACVADCATGYENCDGDLADGCEVEIARDATSCGACGASCGTAGEICIDRSCETPAFASSGSEGAFAPTADVVLSPGVHHFTTITIPEGVVVTTSGSGVLELRATGDVRIAGRVDVTGSRGGHGSAAYPQSDSGGGGTTGTPLAPGVDFDEMTAECGPAGSGGTGATGGNGVTTSSAGCSLGGAFGGGAGGLATGAGGGGGGYAGGGGGMDYQGRAGGAGASAAGNSGGAGASDTTPCTPAQGGQAHGRYAGTSSPGCHGGAGGSIGALAVADLRVATTFRPGSGGGGAGGSYLNGSGGGGGAGGAVRIASATRIEITSTGAVRADGGAGGTGPSGGGNGGGGGSGGVVYLVAPSMQIDGTVSAVGGVGGGGGSPQRGGNGGLGRVRLSVLEEECTITGVVSPVLLDGCGPSAVREHPYVARYPD